MRLSIQSEVHGIRGGSPRRRRRHIRDFAAVASDILRLAQDTAESKRHSRAASHIVEYLAGAVGRSSLTFLVRLERMRAPGPYTLFQISIPP
jgi:hypothetical protein